jgi:hypothetical protein
MNAKLDKLSKLEWQIPEIEIISFQETESGAFNSMSEMGMTDRSDVPS